MRNLKQLICDALDARQYDVHSSRYDELREWAM